MTITLPLEPQEEAKLKALAHAKGLSTEALVREALDGILAGLLDSSDRASSGAATGAALVAALQTSPHKDVDLEAVRTPLPARNVAL